MFKRVLGRVGGGVVLTAAALGVVVVATPGTALAANDNGNVTCTTEIIGQPPITGNVTVPAGASCVLYGDTVLGNVSVGEGASIDIHASYVQRNLSTEGASSVAVDDSEVDGNTSFDATAGNVSVCYEGVSVCSGSVDNPGTPNANPNGKTSKFGNVSITNTSQGIVFYGGNDVAGNLSCYGNTSVTNEGLPNTVLGTESGQCVRL